LAVPERAHRYKTLQDRLVGVSMLGELEPSDHLVDICVAQFDENRLGYIEWQECTKREQELAGLKKDPALRPNAVGAIILSEKISHPMAETGTELLLRTALQRRSLAFELANLITFERAEEWNTLLFTYRLRTQPKGYRQVTIEQLASADKFLFLRMSEICRSGIVPDPAGVRPLDAALATAMKDGSVLHLLMPMQGSDGHKGNAALGAVQAPAVPVAWGQGTGRLARKRRKLLAATAAAAAPPAAAPAAAATGSKGKGKGTGKGPGMPPALQAFAARNSKGDPICFNFNLSGCAPGARCVKGVHECIKCHSAAHGLATCPLP
jgi:hypothetical protein